jgi:hypothetical protein
MLGEYSVLWAPQSITLLTHMFGQKRDEVTGDWRTLHNEEPHNLYSSLNIIRMIKSRRMRWAGHVARMGRGGMHMEDIAGTVRRTETT